MSKAVPLSQSPKRSTSRWRAVVPNRGKRPPAPKTRGKNAKVAKKKQSKATAAGDPTTPDVPTPTRTHYQDLATTLRTALEGLAPQIPFWQVVHPTLRKAIRSARVVNGKFIETVVAAVDSTPELQALNKFDLPDAQDMLQFRAAFRPLVDQLQALSRDLLFTMDTRQAKVGDKALQMYYLAKGLGRDIGGADILSLAENMGRDLGRKRPKPRGKATPPPVTPAPQEPPAPPAAPAVQESPAPQAA
jgi:hypothetical protein